MMIKKIVPSILIFCCSIFAGTPTFATTNNLNSTTNSPQIISTNRLSGHTRYETAKVISEYYGSGKVQNVILSTGNEFADALSASVLSHEKEAPILLVDSSVDSSKDAFDYVIQHLDSTGMVYIIGGNGVIGTDFETKLNTLGFKNIVRIAGMDRYDTSYKVASLLSNLTLSTVVISSGEQYPDALSISSFAANKGWPILLSPHDAFPQEMKNFLLKNKPSKVYITGGTGAISDNVKSEIGSLLPQASVERLTGQSRFETNSIIAQNFAPNPSTVFLSTGYGFADALAGSAVAARNGDPIIFIDPSIPTLPKSVASYFGKLHANNLSSNLVSFGGSGVVPDELLKSSSDLISGIAKETSIYSLADITTTVTLNENYSLPKTAQAKLYNGDIIDVPIKWSSTFVDTSSIGSSIYDGVIDGYSKTIKLNLTVKETIVDLEEKVQAIISKIITPDMSDLRKELVIHEYLIKNAQYDDDNFRNGTIPWDSYTAYGVLIKGIGVCQGYASAANLLLNKAGVKSTMVIGTADGLGGWGGHAWNMVEIDGEHYHLDVTWDESNSKYIDYSYFNLTDDEISKDHKWSRETVPTCSKKFTTHEILVTNTLGIEGENVYFHDNDTLYKIGLDGTGKEMLTKLDGWGPEIRWDGDWLYISQRSHSFPSCFSISKLKRDGSQFTIVREFKVKEEIEDFNIKDGWIYIVLSDRIEKMNDEGSALQTIVTAEQGESIYDNSTIGFDGYWIYYAVSNSSNKLIYYKINTDGTKNIKISESTL